MKTLVLEGFNMPLAIKEIKDLKPQVDEVLIKLQASALNHHDLWTIKEFNADLLYPIILGADGSGKIVETGSNVDPAILGKSIIINPGFDWGSNPRVQSDSFNILGYPRQGTFAEYICVPIQYIKEKPLYLTFEEAAALPLVGLTAYRALFTRAQLQKNEKILITGIGGGVSLMALQLAVAHGANVFVTSSSEDKIKKAIQLGAVAGANYKLDNWENDLLKRTQGFDVIIDGAGGKGFSKLIDLAAPGGRIALFGRTSGREMEVNASKIFWKQLSILGTSMGTPEEFNLMVDFVERHQIKPIIDSVFNMSDGEAAFKQMDEGRNFGKIVLIMG